MHAVDVLTQTLFLSFFKKTQFKAYLEKIQELAIIIAPKSSSHLEYEPIFYLTLFTEDSQYKITPVSLYTISFFKIRHLCVIHNYH